MQPRVADIRKIEKAIQELPKGSIVRLGAMTDCLQPLELEERITFETIKLLNKHEIAYLIVSKSSLVADKDYMEIMDKHLAHIQVSITCLDDGKSSIIEKASPPSERIQAIYNLQDAGFDVSLRLSPFIEEYIDIPLLNSLNINKCLIEFLRADTRIMRSFPDIDFQRYGLWDGNFWHLFLYDKLRLLNMVKLENVTIGDHVPFHHEYWRDNYNPNKYDCCDLCMNRRDEYAIA